MDDKIIIGLLFSLLAASLGIASYYIFKLPEDNPVEEMAEEVIRIYLYLDDIDLSPNSPEVAEERARKAPWAPKDDVEIILKEM